MTKDEIIKELEIMGDPRAVKVWARVGMDTSGYLGVGLTKLKKFAKKTGKNHELANELWNCGIRDAKLLSVFIDEPGKVTPEIIEQRVNELDFWDLSDNFCSYIVVKNKDATFFCERWRYIDSELIKRCSFVTVAGLAKSKQKIENTFFKDYLDQIEKEIKTDKNYTKEGMLIAVIAIGKRNESLKQEAVSCAEKFGKIDIDYGESSCKAPDPYAILTKS